MAEEKVPGVYIEEARLRRSIEGVPTSTVAFVGFAESGPFTPTLIESYRDYSSNFGEFANCAYLPHHCEEMRYRIALLGSPPDSNFSNIPSEEAQSSYAAYYAPWLLVENCTGDRPIAVHPGGHVAGTIARNDVERGVFKAPANIALKGIVGLVRKISKQEQELLNPRGVNVIREFPERGIRIWGARTTSTDSEWKYLNVRRLLIFLERSIDNGTQWAVFEPNGEHLWRSVKRTIEDFLFKVWQDGALFASRADEAYFVRCDRTTMTQDDIENGRLIYVVGVAAVRPAEFVIFRIGQWTADRNC